jgi:uncharacterized membrane protein YsdA (DUF1294 family)
MRNPYLGYGAIAAILVLGFSAAMFVSSASESLSLVGIVLIALNLSTWLMVAWDKAIAGRDITRVPENVLLFLAFVGGAGGLLLGMKLFRHKTRKSSFQYALVAIFGIQALLVLIAQRYLAQE